MIKASGRNGNFDIDRCTSCTCCNSNIPLFSSLNPDELAILNRDRFSVRFKPGETILKQGITGTHILHIINGIAKVFVEAGSRRNLLLYLMKPWMLIDDAATNENSHNHFSVSALTGAQICFIRASSFRMVLASNNLFALEVIRQRQQIAFLYLHRLVSLSQKPMTGRMADGLLYIARGFYQALHFDCVLSRQEIADLTAMSKDSAIRTLKEFERDGVITMNGRSIQIHKPESLEKLAAIG